MTLFTARAIRRRAVVVGLVGSVVLGGVAGLGVSPVAAASGARHVAPDTSDASSGSSGSLDVPRPSPYASVPTGPRTLFVGNYDVGSFSQWGTCQSVAINSGCAKVDPKQYSMQMVPLPGARQGPFGARFEVRKGDVPNFGGGERSEVSSDAPGALTHEGDERWYEWSMYVPPDFQAPRGDYFIVMQWHAGDTGSPPLAINLSKKGTVDIGGDGADAQSRKPRTIGPLRKGQWVDYVLHAGFSKNAKKGFAEAWENGVRTVPRYARQTMSDDENYLKQGIYRSSKSGDGTSVVWLDGLRVSGPEGRSIEPRRHPALCSDATPRGAACTPED